MTAMQQLINEIVEHLTYDDDLTEDSRKTLEKMRIKCESKLELEKIKMIEFAQDYIENFTYGNYDGEVCQSKELVEYFDETYGNKGSDETLKENHIGILSEAVRKETTSSQTSAQLTNIEYWENTLKCLKEEREKAIRGTYYFGYLGAKVSLLEDIFKCINLTSSQTEISVKKQVIEILDKIDYYYDLKGDADWLMNEIRSRLENVKDPTEISDEEIYKQADKEFRHFEDEDKDIWIRACQWYREHLKQRQ